jgi:periplasmic protein TonB
MKRLQIHCLSIFLMLVCLTACVSPMRKAQKKPAPASTPQTETKELIEAKPKSVNPPIPVEQTRVAPPPLADKPVAAEPVNVLRSLARTPKEYRIDAAKHIYQKFPNQIYSGKLPPLLKAVAVLDVVIGPNGQVQELIWARPPSHVPEVMHAIENMVRQAGPFPVPVNLRKVIYTETWLWHSTNRFQLDTLTEGQH